MTDAELRDVAHAVAPHLSGFRVAPDQGNPHNAYLRHSDGRVLIIGRPWPRVDGRVEIRGGYPEHPDAYRLASRPAITVRADRGGAVIAREITRRLLPGYEQALQVTRQAIAKDAADLLGRRQVAARLAAAIGGATVREDGRHEINVYWYQDGTGRGAGKARVWGDGSHVSFDVSCESAAVAERVATAVAGRGARPLPRPHPSLSLSASPPTTPGPAASSAPATASAAGGQDLPRRPPQGSSAADPAHLATSDA
jgi:hypothetical protein